MTIPVRATSKSIFERYRASHARRTDNEQRAYRFVVAIELRNRFNEMVKRLMQQYKVDDGSRIVDFESIRRVGGGWSVVFKSTKQVPDADVTATTPESDFNIFPEYFRALMKDYKDVFGYVTEKGGDNPRHPPDEKALRNFYDSAAVADIILNYRTADIDTQVLLSARATAHYLLQITSGSSLLAAFNAVAAAHTESALFVRAVEWPYEIMEAEINSGRLLAHNSSLAFDTTVRDVKTVLEEARAAVLKDRAGPGFISDPEFAVEYSKLTLREALAEHANAAEAAKALEALDRWSISNRLASSSLFIVNNIVGLAVLGMTIAQRVKAKDPVTIATLDTELTIQSLQVGYGVGLTVLAIITAGESGAALMPFLTFLGPLAIPIAGVLLGIPSIVGNLAEQNLVREIANSKIYSLGNGFSAGYIAYPDGDIVLADVVVKEIDLKNNTITIDSDGMFIKGSKEPNDLDTIIVETNIDINMYSSWTSAQLYDRADISSTVRSVFLQPIMWDGRQPVSNAGDQGRKPIRTVVLSATPITHWRPAYESGGYPDTDNSYLNALHDYSNGFIYVSGGAFKHSLWGLAPTFINSTCTINTAERNVSFVVPDVDDLPTQHQVQTVLRFRGQADPRPCIHYDFMGNGASYLIVLSCYNYNRIYIQDRVPSGWQIHIKKISHEWSVSDGTRYSGELRTNIFSDFTKKQICINGQYILYDGVSSAGNRSIVLIDELEKDHLLFLLVDFDRTVLVPLLASPTLAQLQAHNTAAVLQKMVDYSNTTGAARYMAPISDMSDISGNHQIHYFVDGSSHASVYTMTAQAKNPDQAAEDYTEVGLQAAGTASEKNYIAFVVELMTLQVNTPKQQRFDISGSRALPMPASSSSPPANKAKVRYEGVLNIVMDRAATGHDYVATIEIKNLVIEDADAGQIDTIKASFQDPAALKPLVILSDDQVRADLHRIYRQELPIAVAIPLEFGLRPPTITFAHADGVRERYVADGLFYSSTPCYRWQDNDGCTYDWVGDTVNVVIPGGDDVTTVFLSVPKRIQDLFLNAQPPRQVEFVVGVPRQIRKLDVTNSFYGAGRVCFVPDLGLLKTTGKLDISVSAGFDPYFYSVEIQGSDFVLNSPAEAPAPSLKLTAVVDPAFPQLLTNIQLQILQVAPSEGSPSLQPLDSFNY